LLFKLSLELIFVNIYSLIKIHPAVPTIFSVVSSIIILYCKLSSELQRGAPCRENSQEVYFLPNLLYKMTTELAFENFY